MNTLFALVMTVFLTSGETQDVVTGIYNSESECKAAAIEQKVAGECFPVEKFIRPVDEEIPAGLTGENNENKMWLPPLQ
ncbi:DUF1482 family protein [Escherichia coli]|nr:DUF1482 family protein [Salmonella enterica]MBB7734495.1 DUF1482 family protein [Escherichia coli]